MISNVEKFADMEYFMNAKKNITGMALWMLAVCLMSGMAFGTVTTTFDSTTGFAGWMEVYGGPSDSIALSTNTGYVIQEYMEDLVFLAWPSGSDAGKFYTKSPAGQDGTYPPSVVFPHDGSYIGVRYEAPAGQIITAVSIPTVSFNVDTDMKIQITNADGFAIAQSARVIITDVLNLSATGLNTSAVEIRYVNGAGDNDWWGAPIYAGNTVILDKVLIITTAAGPECGDAQHPRPTGDLDNNCIVNFADAAVMAAHWLEDNRPQ